MSSSTPRARLRLLATGLGIGAVLGGSVLGGGAAFAYFSGTSQATGQTTSPSVAITQMDFESLSHTYTNALASLAPTGSFRVTNTGTSQGALAVSITGGGFLADLPIRVWPVPSATQCVPSAAVPAIAVTGTWASTIVTVASAVSPQESVVFCVRTVADAGHRASLGVPAGSQSAQPNLVATLSAGGWTASAQAAVNTQSTVSIYPLAKDYLPPAASRWFTVRSGANSNLCLEPQPGWQTTGARVTTKMCGRNSPQRWQFTPVVDGDQTLVTLRVRSSPTLRLSVAPNGSPIMDVSTSDSASSRWYVQKISSTRFMLVSQADGRCLSMGSTGDSDATMVDCSDSSAALELQREGLSFARGDSSGTLSFGSALTVQQLQVQYQNRQGAWVTFATTTVGNTSVELPNKDVPSGTWSGRIVLADGSIAYDSLTFVASRSGSFWRTYSLDIVSGMG